MKTNKQTKQTHTIQTGQFIIRQNPTNILMPLSIGETITVIYVNGLFKTVKAVMTVKGKDKKGYYASYKGSKNPVHFYVPKDGLVFRGSKIPLHVYNEAGSQLGNAQINFKGNGDQEVIIQWAKQNNINPYFNEWFRLTVKQHAGIHTLSQPVVLPQAA